MARAEKLDLAWSADFNQDGWMDLFVTNLNHEFYGFYQNRHDETFDDIAAPSGIANATKLMSGWGLKFFDYDNDGNLDLLIANGHPDDLIEKIYDNVTYREPLLLFHNTGKSLTNVGRESGPLFSRPLSGRGLALGDFNNDGAVDVLISTNDGAPVLLKNNVGSKNHWLGVSLVGKTCNRDAVGARITWQTGELKRSTMKIGGGSYLSSHDPRMVLGIGDRKKMDWLEVTWPKPSTLVQRYKDLPIDRYISVSEGEEKWK
jgi:enediyne biosynthesis protein E4